MSGFEEFYEGFRQVNRRPIVTQTGMMVRGTAFIPRTDLEWKLGAIPSEASLMRAYLNDEISIEEYEREVGQLLGINDE
jgi:hypothetical protein